MGTIAALRRLNAATFQHLGYRPATNSMIEVSKSSLNPRISPAEDISSSHLYRLRHMLNRFSWVGE